MSNLRNIPFTEIVERVQDLSRANTETERRIRGIVNEVYSQEIPREYDFTWLKVSTSFLVTASYNSGVVTVDTQDTVLTFSGCTIATDTTGRKIKFGDNANIYDFTYVASNSGTISPPLSGVTNVSNGTYSLFQNKYTLPSDFDRFPVNGGLLFYQAGQPTPLPELYDDDYYERVNASPSTIPEGCRVIGYNTAGDLEVEILPPPSSAYILLAEYFKGLNPMIETTAGTITTSGGTANITGSSTLFTQAKTGDYLRVDSLGKDTDSFWYRVTSITNDTTATISPVFRADTTCSGASYTICGAPNMPYRLQDAIIYGAIKKTLADAKDPIFLLAHANYAKILTTNISLDVSRHAKDDIELIAEDSEYRR